MYRLLVILLLSIPLQSLVAEPKEAYVMEFSEKYTGLYDSLKSRGFCEIGNYRFMKADYSQLYRNFDNFIELMGSNKAFSARMYDLEKEFLSVEVHKSRYCSAPPSYRDPRIHATKRFNKVYFQFIKEHYDFILKAQVGLLESKASVIDFFADMKMLDGMAKELFSKIVDLLDVSRPGIKAILYGNHQELTVLSKIVRYEKTEGWATSPHCDKSAITLIWGSDEDGDESLLLCDDMQNPSLKKLRKPDRLFSQKDDVTSTILISGAACSKVGIDLDPTVHGVAPIKKEYRHAVISFLLIPDIDMSDITTDFVDPVVG